MGSAASAMPVSGNDEDAEDEGTKLIPAKGFIFTSFDEDGFTLIEKPENGFDEAGKAEEEGLGDGTAKGFSARVIDLLWPRPVPLCGSAVAAATTFADALDLLFTLTILLLFITSALAFWSLQLPATAVGSKARGSDGACISLRFSSASYSSLRRCPSVLTRFDIPTLLSSAMKLNLRYSGTHCARR